LWCLQPWTKVSAVSIESLKSSGNIEVGADHDVGAFLVRLVGPVAFSNEAYCGVVEVYVEAAYGVDTMEGLGKTASLIAG
jgi:hypothetical protein